MTGELAGQTIPRTMVEQLLVTTYDRGEGGVPALVCMA